VYKALVPCIWKLALATSVLVGQNPSAGPAQQALSPGVVLPRQVCAAKPDQSYALYLPSHYIASKRWPIVYAFDPDGRGNIPVELMQAAAERYGYIIVGSNNSRNGSWKLETDAAQAMLEDTLARLSIDDRRIYFAGFSGGARVAALLAQRCKCAAGVLLSGAGFAGTPPSSDAVFAVFAAVGSFDFNYSELSDLDEKLQQAGFPHVLRHFDGPHEWAPAEVLDEALAWFQLVAMKQNREARNDSFVAQQKTAAVARAQALEQNGQPYEAWREYRQAIATFDGLTDTASMQQVAASLAEQRAVRDGPKREKQDFQEQAQLTSQIYSGLAALRGGGGSSQDSQQTHSPAGQPDRSALAAVPGYVFSRPEIRQQTEEQIVALRQHASAEKNPDKVRIYRRALAGVFVAAAESGDESLTAKNYTLAGDYFQLATVAAPDSAGALKGLATALALAGDRKGACETLRRAREKSKDPAAFSAWLKEEPAFAKLHDDPQFRALLANP
jgi:predicted esterase